MEILKTIPISELLKEIGIMFLLLYVILCIAVVIKKKHRVKKYLRYFNESRSENLREVLTRIRRNYRRTSKEYKAIENALHYMDHSITRDYENALEILNKFFATRKVRKFHEIYLKETWEKKQNMEANVSERSDETV